MKGGVVWVGGFCWYPAETNSQNVPNQSRVSKPMSIPLRQTLTSRVAPPALRSAAPRASRCGPSVQDHGFPRSPALERVSVRKQSARVSSQGLSAVHEDVRLVRGSVIEGLQLWELTHCSNGPPKLSSCGQVTLKRKTSSSMDSHCESAPWHEVFLFRARKKQAEAAPQGPSSGALSTSGWRSPVGHVNASWPACCQVSENKSGLRWHGQRSWYRQHLANCQPNGSN